MVVWTESRSCAFVITHILFSSKYMYALNFLHSSLDYRENIFSYHLIIII